MQLLMLTTRDRGKERGVGAGNDGLVQGTMGRCRERWVGAGNNG